MICSLTISGALDHLSPLNVIPCTFRATGRFRASLPGDSRSRKLLLLFRRQAKNLPENVGIVLAKAGGAGRNGGASGHLPARPDNGARAAIAFHYFAIEFPGLKVAIRYQIH